MNFNIAKNLCVTLAVMMGLASCGNIEAPEPARFIPDWRTYESQQAGISFEYPYNLSLDADTSSDGELSLELQWVGRGTPVFQLETGKSDPDWVAEGGAEVAGVKATETMVTIGGEPMRRIAVANAGRFYTFTGSGATFEKILESVSFSE